MPSGDLLFVAPAMISHYVQRHEYAPRAEFVEAVMSCPLPNTAKYRAACAVFRELHKRAVAERAREQEM